MASRNETLIFMLNEVQISNAMLGTFMVGITDGYDF
jgi:hypothetical protein